MTPEELQAMQHRITELEERFTQQEVAHALRMLHIYWRMVPAATQLQFLLDVHTPPQRRAIARTFMEHDL